jgi:hypothetical protein
MWKKLTVAVCVESVTSNGGLRNVVYFRRGHNCRGRAVNYCLMVSVTVDTIELATGAD